MMPKNPVSGPGFLTFFSIARFAECVKLFAFQVCCGYIAIKRALAERQELPTVGLWLQLPTQFQ